MQDPTLAPGHAAAVAVMVVVGEDGMDGNDGSFAWQQPLEADSWQWDGNEGEPLGSSDHSHGLSRSDYSRGQTGVRGEQPSWRDELY